MNQVIGIILLLTTPLMFVGALALLSFLVEKYPPYDPQPDMQKLKRQKEEELKAHRERL